MMMFPLALMISFATPPVADSVATPTPPSVTLAVYPPDVHLETARDTQSFAVQATYPDGVTRDVTGTAKIALADPKIATLQGAVLTPLADGKTQLSVSFEGQNVQVPVSVTQAKIDRPVSFKLDVMPVFLRSGCNSGGCHGAARGKDGFRLSLFGFDPDGDHFRLTREMGGRRVNLALPNESLLLDKACGKVPHTGGQKMKEGDQYTETLIRWIEANCPTDAQTVATPVSMEVYPPAMVFDGKGETQRLSVRAKYSDGTDRDVTKLALFMSNNDTSATIDADTGTVTAGERGEAFVMARFHTFTVGVPVITLPKGLKADSRPMPVNNYIDEYVNAKLRKLRIQSSGICDDSTFIRRVTLDITGTLPTAADYGRFMVSSLPNKRELLIDELLGRKEFAELWVLKWAELLQIRSSNEVSPKAMLLYFNWLQDKIARDVPTDVWVKELLGASGGTFKTPATNYYQLEREVVKVTENVAQVFMGMRVQCAQCHNHPFDRWTMDDYYGFAAFFTQVGRKRGEDPREVVVFNSGGGEVNHPVRGKPMPPKFLGGEVADVAGKDRRKVVAEWLASSKNPYFAKNLSNVVWAHFFGIGVIDQVDDVRVSNPASNQALLEEMAKRFTAGKYNFKSLVKEICMSAAYQRSTETNESNEKDARNFAHGPVRRIRAETMLDIINQVTDTKTKYRGLPLGARAVEIADGKTSNYFLTTFGRPMRETVCSCEVRLEPTLSQSLHLMNGNTVGPKIQQGKLAQSLLAAGRSPGQVIETMYVSALSRTPTPKELEKLTAAVETAKNKNAKQQVLDDIFWAILNSREFMFNH